MSDLYDNDFEKFVYTKVLPVFLLAIVKIASL